MGQRRGTFSQGRVGRPSVLPAALPAVLPAWVAALRAAAACLSLGLVAVFAGCTAPPVEPDLNAREAVEKVPAIVDANDDRRLDPREVAALIRSLDHTDPAIRFFAARTLRDRTGQDFGYVYYRDPRARRAAADRWRAWYKQQLDGITIDADNKGYVSPAAVGQAAPATSPDVSAAP